MKSVLFATAILFAGAATAQTTTYQTTTTTTATSQVAQPSNANPELDARGIPVISDPATVPAGFNAPPGMGGPMVDASSPPAPQPATENYPACSRTVTDNCVQTYERGRRR
jgi:hypothetical protein